MKKRYGAFLATSAMVLGALMMPAAATAAETADTDEDVCGYTETQYTRVIHHEAETHEETQYAREYTETRYVQTEVVPPTYETVTWVEWQRVGVITGLPYGSPEFFAPGATKPGAGLGLRWKETGNTEDRDGAVIDPGGTEVVDEKWAEEDPGGDWEATDETRTETEYQWGTESPGEGWSETGVTRTVVDEPAYHDAPEYQWATESPGDDWSETGETRFVEEPCPAAPVDETGNDVQPAAVVGALPNTGGPSAMIGIIAALVLGAGGLLLTAARKFGNA